MTVPKKKPAPKITKKMYEGGPAVDPKALKAQRNRRRYWGMIDAPSNVKIGKGTYGSPKSGVTPEAEPGKKTGPGKTRKDWQGYRYVQDKPPRAQKS